MTREEAILGVKTWYYKMKKIHKKDEFATEFIESANLLAVDAEKYKWHDLRKNPDDLPQEDGIYLCACKFGKSYYYRSYPFEEDTFGFYYYDNEYGYSKKEGIVAWKSEPFEEVEE